MSHASPEPSPWREPPTFSIAHTGYLSGDVQRLLEALEDAADRGEPLDPLIDARSLTTVSFGDDMGEVDAFLAELRSNDDPGPHATSGAVNAPEPLPSVSPEAPLNSRHQQILALVDAASFRMTGRSVGGYEVGSVDDFIGDLVTRVEAGESVLPTIRNVRFPMAPRGSGGYNVSDVDHFLDRIQSTAAGSASAPKRSVVQDPDERSAGKGLITPILWTLGIAVMLYLALFVL